MLFLVRKPFSENFTPPPLPEKKSLTRKGEKFLFQKNFTRISNISVFFPAQMGRNPAIFL